MLAHVYKKAFCAAAAARVKRIFNFELIYIFWSFRLITTTIFRVQTVAKDFDLFVVAYVYKVFLNINARMYTQI